MRRQTADIQSSKRRVIVGRLAAREASASSCLPSQLTGSRSPTRHFGLANRDTVVFEGDVAAVDLDSERSMNESADGGETRKRWRKHGIPSKGCFQRALKESVKEKCKQRRRQRGRLEKERVRKNGLKQARPRN